MNYLLKIKVKDKKKLNNPLKGWQILSSNSSMVFHIVHFSIKKTMFYNIFMGITFFNQNPICVKFVPRTIFEIYVNIIYTRRWLQQLMVFTKNATISGAIQLETIALKAD